MTAIALFMAMMGVGIGLIWTRDIIKAEQIDVTRGRLRSHDLESGSPMLPHWIAEYGTAAGLIAGSVGLLLETGWSEPVSLVALGALVYTSVNSLGWVLAERRRRPYAVPMTAGIIGGLASIIGLSAF